MLLVAIQAAVATSPLDALTQMLQRLSYHLAHLFMGAACAFVACFDAACRVPPFSTSMPHSGAPCTLEVINLTASVEANVKTAHTILDIEDFYIL